MKASKASVIGALCLSAAALGTLGARAQEQAKTGSSAAANVQGDQVAATAAPGAGSVVPRLIKFSGQTNPQITQITPNKDHQSGKAPTPITLSFSLYELQESGSPLWSESQTVQPDNQGRYTVLLGATQAEGLPLDLFTSGKALWLGVPAAIAGCGGTTACASTGCALRVGSRRRRYSGWQASLGLCFGRVTSTGRDGWGRRCCVVFHFPKRRAGQAARRRYSRFLHAT